ncbi:MAG: NUDIX domain-containing protein [Defluviitaleaceae bacterium]|nr:NUDIX domain-containing protein [Defluviitaleaceae bacterium]
MSYKMRMRAGAIIIHEDKILINKFGDGIYYNIPGGGIEKDENARTAVEREVFEETSLRVIAKELVFTLESVPHEKQTGENDEHSMGVFFKCVLVNEADAKSMSLNGLLPDKNPINPSLTATAIWFSIYDLPKIELVPKIAKNLIEYHETGIFVPTFYTDPRNY